MNGNVLESLAAFVARPIQQARDWPVVDALGWALVHFLWQGTAVALLLAVLLLVLRSRPANIRYAVACGGMLFMTALPLASFFWLWSNASAPQTLSNGARRDLSPHVASVEATANKSSPTAAPLPRPAAAPVQLAPVGRAGLTQAARARQSRADFVGPVLPWFVAAWLAGVAVLTLRLCVGWLRIQRMRRVNVRPAAAYLQASLTRLCDRMRIGQCVTLLESALVEVPTMLGWLRPVILLPPSALMGLLPEQLEAILAHELAHVRRHDYLVNLFQTALETLLFYHPAVWWISRVVRLEREACCDEIAVEVCGNRLEYARALTSLETLRGIPRQLAVAAGGAPLVDRIRRVLGVPAPRANQSAWWVMAAVAAGVFVIAMIALPGSTEVQAGGPRNSSKKAVPRKPATRKSAAKKAAEKKADAWGDESDGLRCRLVAVPAASDDESPDMNQATEEFKSGDDVTFAVELKNVRDKPLTLLGVRYGDSYPTAKGKLAAESFAPHLFEFEFSGADGKPVPRASRVFLESMLELSGASAHEIAAGESLVVLLRPAKFRSPMEHRLPPGGFRAVVHYRGPSKQTLAQLNKHWPDKPQAKAWSGEVTSNSVGFTIAADPAAREPAPYVWGEVKDGLQAAVEFRRYGGAGAFDDPAGNFPLNTVLDVVYHLKNVSEKPISLVSETWRQDDPVTVKNEAGEEQQVNSTWYSGWPIMVRWTLGPGEVADIQSSTLAVAAEQAVLEKFEHPVGKSLIVPPGKYTVRFTIRLGAVQTKDDKGNVIIPAKDDWQDEIVTGDTPLIIRARTPEDDARERLPTFVGRIEFVGADGKPVESGTFEARTSTQRGDPPLLEIRRGINEVPDCTAKPLTIYVRSPGYEEAYVHDIILTADETKRIELKPAAATRFRLVSALDGAPLAGAAVRFFNKSSGKASAGPYPMKGIEGPVWATSQADGVVLLDTLQRVDPFYAELGDAVYYFYVETPGLAPLFLGPVKAGQDLGDVTVGPFLEARGEVRGTLEELDRFAAEWDQPFELTSDNPAAAWLYAVSKPLETAREGDKLTFHLTGLRPGKLRIVANFGPQPHKVSHTYTRRDPQGSDIVVQVELKDSIDDLVVEPEKK